MSSPTSSSRAFGFLAALALASLSACLSPAEGYRDLRGDPDLQLRELWDAYRAGSLPATGERGSSTVITDRAQHAIEKLAVEYPRHVPTLFAVAAIAYEQREYEKASTYLDALFHVQPAHAEAGILRARIAIADGSLPSAERVLRQQIRYTPDDAELHEMLASVLFLAKDLKGAKGELDLADRLGAPEARVAFNLGLVAEAEGQDAAAAGYYDRALAAQPEFPEANSRLAGLRARSGEAVR